MAPSGSRTRPDSARPLTRRPLTRILAPAKRTDRSRFQLRDQNCREEGEGTYARANKAEDEPPQDARHQLLFRFVRQDQLAMRSWVGVHHELARRRHPRAVVHGRPRIAARRAVGIERIARREELLYIAHRLAAAEEVRGAEIARAHKVLDVRGRLAEAGAYDRLLDNDVGALRKNATPFPPVLLPQEVPHLPLAHYHLPSPSALIL